MTLQLNLVLELWVNLGVPAIERATPQQVLVKLSLAFPQGCAGMQSDQLEDTVCYATLYQQLQAYCAERSFQLLEYLASQLRQELERAYPQLAVLELSVHKKPPLAAIQEAVVTLR